MPETSHGRGEGAHYHPVCLTNLVGKTNLVEKTNLVDKTNLDCMKEAGHIF